ncbi:PAAR domain-containing protein [Paenibacillus monticola]|nr:PAAR domain-containing protein [Paenibacillus monticola]
MIPAGSALVPTPLPHPFTGILDGALSANVKIMGQPAATVDSTATNTPAHVPQGGPFQKPPANQGKIIAGSATVKINGKMAARNSDPALTCNDPADLPAGKVVAAGTVLIGG